MLTFPERLSLIYPRALKLTPNLREVVHSTSLAISLARNQMYVDKQAARN